MTSSKAWDELDPELQELLKEGNAAHGKVLEVLMEGLGGNLPEEEEGGVQRHRAITTTRDLSVWTIGVGILLYQLYDQLVDAVGKDAAQQLLELSSSIADAMRRTGLGAHQPTVTMKGGDA